MSDKDRGANLKQLVYLVILTLCVELIAHGQTPSEPQTLTLDQAREREISGTEIHAYRVDLQKNEFFQVRVEQKGIDVALSIHSADGQQLSEMDSPNGKEGPETISFIADKAGAYFVRVKRLDESTNSASGKYTITLTAKRSPLAQDRRRVEVEKLFVEGMKAVSANGQEEIALAKLEKALKGWEELSDQYAADLTKRGLEEKGIMISIEAGTLFSQQTEETRQAAIAKLESAVRWFERIGSKTEAAAANMIIISVVYFLFDEHEKALHYANLSYDILKTVGNQKNAVSVLAYTGFIYSFMGHNQKAVQAFEEGLALYREVSDEKVKAELKSVEDLILNGLGKAYSDLGDKKKALEYFEQARSHYAAMNNADAVARTLHEISKAYSGLGDIQNALRFDELALGMFKELGDKQGEASILNDYGAIATQTGKQNEALTYFSQALLLCKADSSTVKKKRSMVDMFNVRNLIALADTNSNCEALTHTNLMSYWQKLGSSRFAIFHGKQAVNKYEELRKKSRAISKEFKKLYRKSIENTYRQLADLLITEGRIAEAEQVLGMLKEEEVFAYLRRDDKVAKELLQTVSLTAEEREALKRYDEFADKITAIGKEFGELDAERKKYDDGQFPKQARYEELKNQLADATTAFQRFLEQLKIKFSQRDVRVAQVDSSLQNTLKRLNASHAAVVSTIVGENRLNIIVTTADTQRAHTIDITEREVNQLVADFRQALTNPKIDPRPAGQKLYDLLVKPIEADLSGIEADTILWSLDGTLRYVPTAALWDSQKGYLVERFASVMLMLASRETLVMPVSDKRTWKALGVGVSKATDGFSALNAVPDELDCIITDPQTKTVSLKPICQNGVMAGRKLLDENFTRAAFEDSLGRFPIVHIASHFSLNPGNDKDSFLLLGGGEQRRFTVENLRRLSLTEVELIVLSACNTATPGGENTNGVEIESFGTVAQQRGAKAVSATLWSVADDSTRQLMVKFYQLYDKGDLTKAHAMRQAQLAMLYGKFKPADGSTLRGAELAPSGNVKKQPAFKKEDKAPFAHPYFWSPFILIGNWK